MFENKQLKNSGSPRPPPTPLPLLSLLNLKMSQNLILSARKFLRPLLFHVSNESYAADMYGEVPAVLLHASDAEVSIL